MFEKPGVVGVPDRTPAELSDRPAGTLPDGVHVAAPALPTAPNAYEYGTPTNASGNWLSLLTSGVTFKVDT